MKRVILILVIVAVLGGGTLLVVRLMSKSSGETLLEGINVDLQAKQYVSAAERAQEYIQKYPDDWKGYERRGRALLLQGKYDETREVVQLGLKQVPNQVNLVLHLAESYRDPGVAILEQSGSQRTAAEYDRALELVRQSEAVLDAFRKAVLADSDGISVDSHDRLTVDERLGQIYRAEAAMLARQSQALAGEAKVAEVQGNAPEAERKRRRSEEAREAAKARQGDALRELGKVILADPTRGLSADDLVGLCIWRGETAMLESLLVKFEQIEKPPVLASTRLSTHCLQVASIERDDKKHDEMLKRTRAFLAKLLNLYPKDLGVKVANAQGAEYAREYETAERLARETVENGNMDLKGALVLSRLLLRTGRFGEAENLLHKFTNQHKNSIDWRLQYAEVLRSAGKRETAIGMMRVVVDRLDPGNPKASLYLVRINLEDGLYDQALKDAEMYYARYPHHPMAVGLFAQAAILAKDRGRAEDALEKALAEQADNPTMMVQVAAGYRLLGNAEKTRQTLEKAVSATSAGVQHNLAVAQALRHLGRAVEAERILNEELRRDPDQPNYHVELGALYVATGRPIPALDEYRTAVRLAAWNPRFRLRLARLLLELDDVDQCESVLEPIGSENADARELRSRISILRGETVSPEEESRRVEDARKRGGVALAEFYLNRARLNDCIQVCEKELRENPRNRRLLFLAGQAHLAQDNRKECLDFWSRMIRAEPKDIIAYWQVAVLLATQSGPAEAIQTLSSFPAARKDLVQLAAGRLYASRRDLDAAIAAYRELVSDAKAPEDSRNRGRVGLAGLLASKRDFGGALGVLDELARDEQWRRIAMRVKAEILVRAGYASEAMAPLNEFRRLASSAGSAADPLRAGGLFLGARQHEKALLVAAEAITLSPNEPQCYWLRARALGALGRRDEAYLTLEKAIEVQPGRVASYLLLVRAHDAANELAEALAVLDRTAKVSSAGRVQALFGKGAMLFSRGLATPAIQCYEQLAKEEHAHLPRIRCLLGQAFAALGQREQAKDALTQVPEYSDYFEAAQMALVAVAESEQEKLAILAGLDRARPGRLETLRRRLDILLAGGKPGEARKTFDAFTERYLKDKPVPPSIAHRVVRAMVESDDVAAAVRLTQRMAREWPKSQWPYLTALLAAGSNPALAKAMLPDIDKADFRWTLLGVMVAGESGDAAALGHWAKRLEGIAKEWARAERPAQIGADFSVLVALMQGQSGPAKQQLARFSSAGVTRSAVTELVARAESGANVAAEASALLKVALVSGQDMGYLRRRWALGVLRANPTSQWAAYLALHSQASESVCREVLALLRPDDCTVALLVRGLVLRAEGKFDEASAFCARAVAAEKDNSALILHQARMVEAAGRFDEAIALYRKVWDVSKNPEAGNAIAYLTSQMHPDDKAKLTEALEMVKASPAPPAGSPAGAAVLDTRGWIEFLLGRKAEARSALRQAIRGLRSSPEGHYHLAVVEADAGNEDLARWHLESAVRSVEAAREAGSIPTAGSRHAEKVAREALAKLPTKDP